MSIIYMLLAISVVVAVVFFVAFILSVRQGQYDDTYTPSVRMLFEDELVKAASKTSKDTPQPKTQNNANRKLK
tara:strand:- start:698 stop:916 length:219 start_codon:yes stop_codon:yes gene_type:complete